MPFIQNQVILSMNSKTKYMIPAFAAMFALVFALVTPYSMADQGAEDRQWKDGVNWEEKGHHMGPKDPMRPHAILVEDFTGSVVLPEEMSPETHESLKSQVTVSLGQAVTLAEEQGIKDAMKASIGIVDGSDGNKYLVWTIFSMDKDEETEIITNNIFVVDAGDITNYTTVSKTFDPSEMKEKLPTNSPEKFGKFGNFAPTGDADVDAARTQFDDLMQQLREAYQNGDTETAESIKDQLQELQQTFLDVRNSKF